MKLWNRLRQWWQASSAAQKAIDHAKGKEHGRMLLQIGITAAGVYELSETIGSTAFGEGMKEAVREWEAAQVGIYSVMKGRVE